MSDYKFTELQEAWLQALESDDYQQGRFSLISLGSYGNKRYCCLGVFCDVAIKFGLDIEVIARACPRVHPDDFYVDGQLSVLSPRLQNILGLHSPSGDIDETTSLTSMNDNGMTFKQIAAFIRANPEKVFKSNE